MIRTAAALVLALALTPTPAAAQTASSTSGPRVEVEAYGAFGHLFDGGDTALSLPAPGAPIGTSSPFFPSRKVSSWLFGDGSALLNDVNAQLGVSARVTPLDAAIATIGRGAETGIGCGGRIRLRTTEHVWMEAAVDVSRASNGLADSVAAAVETTRASFVQAMTGLFASGPFTGTSVTATTTLPETSYRDITISVAANVELTPVAGVTPYMTLGGGVVTRVGTTPQLTIEGHYRTRILGGSPIDETDRVTIRSTSATAPGLVVGGGFARTIADHVALRLDARLFAANRTVSTSLDATPSVATGTPADFIESFTSPSVQFSNNASTGRKSTLSGDAIDHLDVARSTRLQLRGLVTFGVAIRF